MTEFKSNDYIQILSILWTDVRIYMQFELSTDCPQGGNLTQYPAKDTHTRAGSVSSNNETSTQSKVVAELNIVSYSN